MNFELAEEQEAIKSLDISKQIQKVLANRNKD